MCPAGLNTVLGRIDQDNVLATVRGSEVMADPTAALALEAAVRRRAGDGTVRLATTHRVLRLQPLSGEGIVLRHFRLLALVTAGPSSRATRSRRTRWSSTSASMSGCSAGRRHRRSG